MTVPELCRHLHNYFDARDDPVAGQFTFTPDTIPSGVVQGQYFLVCGSIFNDGIHKAGDGDLTAETFTGTVQPMRVPPDIVALAKKITDYDAATPGGGRYVSQSFNGWSGSMATGTDGLPADGLTRYRKELNQWRKL